MPLSAFLAFFACTFFFALGFAVFATVLALAIILPLSFHHEDEDDMVDFDAFFFAILLPPLNLYRKLINNTIIYTYRSKVLIILHRIIQIMADEKVNEIVALLKKNYPDVKIALDFSNPLELLIATILSAQSTDKQINKVTKTLFKKYRTPQDYVKTPQEELEKDIYSTGFYRNKTKNIKKLCEILVNDFNSKVPDTMEDLITLPGVARKTANIVLSSAFGKREGIAVDTHVKRVSARLGFTKNTDPDKIEKDLMKTVPRNEWDIFALRLIQHGREICIAKKPKCEICFLNKVCPSAFTFG